MTTILGINAFHGDASACLIRDGAIAAAAEEERFRRIKHWAGFPGEAIRYCLRRPGSAWRNRSCRGQSGFEGQSRQEARVHAGEAPGSCVGDRSHPQQARAAGVETHLAGLLPGQEFRGRVHAVEHHVAHLSSAFHVSPFAEAVAVSVDGFGDFASAAWGVGRGTRIDVEDRVYFPHSLGIFYQAITQFIGFPHYGDEYKVMGLAPYGQPTFLGAMRRIVSLEEGGGFRLDLDYFRHHSEKIDYEWENGSPTVGTLYSSKIGRIARTSSVQR
jgi:carbamoyltransferase